MNSKYFQVFLFVSVILIISCSRHISKVAFPTLHDGNYDSEFPYNSCSDQLKEISDRILKVYSIVGYENFIFEKHRFIKKADLTKALLKNADQKTSFRSSTMGTGLLLYAEYLKIGVLTCAHTFNKPDTIFTFYKGLDDKPSKFLYSIAIKKTQSNYIPEMPEDGKFDILVLDTDNDVALLGKELKTHSTKYIRTFNYPVGSAKELNWGSFVYIFGYPQGYKMVTKGIVSAPDRTHHGRIVVDALFNKGMSGGLVLAIRDGVPNFEMVGMATSSAAKQESVLVPDKKATYSEQVPYIGDLYVENRRDITYGVTLAVTTDVIEEVLKKHQDHLIDKGYSIRLGKK